MYSQNLIRFFFSKLFKYFLILLTLKCIFISIITFSNCSYFLACLTLLITSYEWVITIKMGKTFFSFCSICYINPIKSNQKNFSVINKQKKNYVKLLFFVVAVCLLPIPPITFTFSPPAVILIKQFPCHVIKNKNKFQLLLLCSFFKKK